MTERNARFAAYRVFDVQEQAKERDGFGVVSVVILPPVGDALQMEDDSIFQLENGANAELE